MYHGIYLLQRRRLNNIKLKYDFMVSYHNKNYVLTLNAQLKNKLSQLLQNIYFGYYIVQLINIIIIISSLLKYFFFFLIDFLLITRCFEFVWSFGYFILKVSFFPFNHKMMDVQDVY